LHPGGLHLTHRDFEIPVSSWAAVKPNGTGLPSTFSQPRLGAVLPSPEGSGNENKIRVHKPNSQTSNTKQLHILILINLTSFITFKDPSPIHSS
jgi:hypothetical protein